MKQKNRAYRLVVAYLGKYYTDNAARRKKMRGEYEMSFGKNLQFLRHLRGNMTQEDLAEKMNVSRQTVSKWELDIAQPEMDKAIELCKFFNCSLDNLFRDDMVVCGEVYTNLRVEWYPLFAISNMLL